MGYHNKDVQVDMECLSGKILSMLLHETVVVQKIFQSITGLVGVLPTEFNQYAIHAIRNSEWTVRNETDNPTYICTDIDAFSLWTSPSWLVVWTMTFMTFHSVGNVIIPTDELHHFSEG